MGNCFKPSASKSPIYINLIEKIITEANKANNTEIYPIVSQRIHKKGDLRKLIDHLQSHRYNILKSLIYIGKLQSQPKNNVPLLVIINDLVRNLPNFIGDQFNMSKNKSKKKNKKTQSISKMNGGNSKEVEVNFEMMYFPIIMTMFDVDSSLRSFVMQSVRKYAFIRKDKFTYDKYISQMFTRLLILIKAGKLVSQCIETMNSLMIKSNSYLAHNQIKNQALFLLLNVWIQTNDTKIQYHCSNILTIYIYKSMQSRQSQQLFSTIINLYDRYNFNQNQVIHLEAKVLLCLEQEQSKEQFQKGLFKYLMTYLSMSYDPRVRTNWERIIFQTHCDLLINLHQNISQTSSKINGFSTLFRWIRYKFVDIDQLIIFNRQAFYYCFKFNIFGQNDQQLLTKVLTTFVEIYQLSNQTSKFMLTQLIIQDINSNNNSFSLFELQSIIWIARQFIIRCPTFEDNQAIKFFIPLCALPQERLKLQQIVLMYALLLDKCKIPYSYSVLEVLCEVTYSFYYLLDIQESLIKQKQSMLDSIVYFMMKLQQKGYSDFILIWVNLLPKSKNSNAISRYFDKLIVLQIWQKLTATPRIPNQMIQLNRNIKKSSNSDAVGEIWAYQQSHPQLKTLSRLSPIQNPQQINTRSIFIKQKINKLFKVQRIIQASQKDSQRPIRQFHRKSSIVTSQPSYKTDESFQQIFGMLSNKKSQQQTTDENPISEFK